eukprot:358298-Chlamydomonas_euryale.AAC.4
MQRRAADDEAGAVAQCRACGVCACGKGGPGAWREELQRGAAHDEAGAYREEQGRGGGVERTKKWGTDGT